MTRDDYPTWHRDIYIPHTTARPGPITRAWQRLRVVMRRPGKANR